MQTHRILDQFRAALIARDIIPPQTIIADGILHRCAALGRPGRRDAAYVLHLDGVPAGGFENWRDGQGWQNWRYDLDREMTEDERHSLAHRARVTRASRDQQAEQKHAAARLRASRIWDSAGVPAATHAYLEQKGIEAPQTRVRFDTLLVPVLDLAGQLHSLQFISPRGEKRFLRGGRVQGLCTWVGQLPEQREDSSLTVCIAEGLATAASVHEACGHTAFVAFHAGNLSAVARALRERFPHAKIIVCADDDRQTSGNPGLVLAREAASAVNGWLAMPEFGEARQAGDSDFNDLHRRIGLSAVRASLGQARLAASTPESLEAMPSVDKHRAWSVPESLSAPSDGAPYPLDALPLLLKEAIAEAHACVQAPVALVACSAHAALSVVAQGLANVRRDHQLVGPTSLYLLSVADSGERKTSCDRIFGKALRDWEQEQSSAASAAIVAHDSASAAFEAKRLGLLESIKRKRRDGKETGADEAALDELSTRMPTPVKVPRLIYADATPEALSHALATGWPSAAVLSSEAGAVFGAHGMSYETILRNLALLNVLWDGGEIAVDRRSKSSFQLRDRRLTFGVMVQPEALRGFIERAGTLPRGSGFIARFLIAWPASTQGTRLYRAAPESMPAVERLTMRMRSLLATPLQTDARGGLDPVVLELSDRAHHAWARAHDDIERELGRGGRYSAVRDVAAKAAENIARLAALWHVLEVGPHGVIEEGAILGASRVVIWHLQEARRLLDELDTPMLLRAVIRLDDWLLGEARRSGSGRIPVTRVYQYGPSISRDSEGLRKTIDMLSELGRARLEHDGRRRFVSVNPALLED